MNIKKYKLGDDIYIGDIEREIGATEGVLNVIDTRVFNEYGNGYSSTITTQATVENEEEKNSTSVEIDLVANQYTLNSEADEMFEIKYPERDIRIKVMQR
jgi:activator of HSP90 ATPase